MTKDEQCCKSHGIIWMPRGAFFGECKINPYNDESDNQSEWKLLEDRVRQREGAWVIFDPSDNSEGWCLVHDDLAGIIAETADRFRDMELDGTSGQDRDSYSDTQDRQNYT